MWKINFLKMITYLSMVGVTYISIYCINNWSIMKSVFIVLPTVIAFIIISIGHLETLHKLDKLKHQFKIPKEKYLARHERKLRKKLK